MAEKGKVYVCALCGQEVEVVKSGMGTLVCCGKEMKSIEDKTESTVNLPDSGG